MNKDNSVPFKEIIQAEINGSDKETISLYVQFDLTHQALCCNDRPLLSDRAGESVNYHPRRAHKLAPNLAVASIDVC